MVWLYDGGMRIWLLVLIQIQYTNVEDRHPTSRTDRQTLHDGIGDAMQLYSRAANSDDIEFRLVSERSVGVFRFATKVELCCHKKQWFIYTRYMDMFTPIAHTIFHHNWLMHSKQAAEGTANENISETLCHQLTLSHSSGDSRYCSGSAVFVTPGCSGGVMFSFVMSFCLFVCEQDN